MSSADKISTVQLSEFARRLEASSGFRSSSRRQGIDSVGEAAWEVANAVADVFAASSRLVRELIPRALTVDISDEELDETLNDIGEELRHILYHIKDTRYFGYVVDDASPADSM